MAELRLSTWGIKNPIPVALVFLAAVFAGAISYAFLPIKQFPNVVFPAVLVIVTENGAAPAEIKTQITRPIEDAMAGIAGVRDIQSQIAEGVVDDRGSVRAGRGPAEGHGRGPSAGGPGAGQPAARNRPADRRADLESIPSRS